MWIIQLVKQSLMITGFVLVVMIIIEYTNTQSKGNWSKPFRRSKFLQIIFASLMGIVPGCLGTYTVVSLYTHNVINFGALVAALVATSGDEAFIMFSMIPETALIITGVLFVVAVLSGLLVNLFFKKKNFKESEHAHFEIHEKYEACKPFQPHLIGKQLKNITFLRAVLMFVIILFTANLALKGIHVHEGDSRKSEKNESVTDEHHHNHSHEHHEHEVISIKEEKAGILTSETHEHPIWISVTFMLLAVFALFIITTVPQHFLELHVWQHVIKVHFLKIFLWTFGALIFLHFLETWIDVNAWLKENMIFILLAAVLIGFIPESGPHMVFVSLFMAGTIPLSILIASSISQDGHGALPLFAESKKSFFIAKFINALIAFVVGYVGILLA